MARIEIKVTLANISWYDAYSRYTFRDERTYVYVMRDEDGKTYVWKTQNTMGMKVESNDNDYFEIDAKGRRWKWVGMHKGDIVRIKATVKGEDTYNGEPQTIVNRVTVIERLFDAEAQRQAEAKAKEEEHKRKVQEQQDSIQIGDRVVRMPYRQYKDHYADCETVIDSFESADISKGTYAQITVIIRKGRMKASGVRGKHFSYFTLENEEGATQTFKAICFENALKRVQKLYPDHTWKYNSEVTF